MSIEYFLNRANIQLLWDVLIEEPTIKNICTSNKKINEIAAIFETNIQPFYYNEKQKCSNLVELNKKYILLLVNYIVKINNEIKTNYNTNTNSASQNKHSFKKIKIHNDSQEEHITFEEIQNARLSNFEKDLSNKQQEFNDAMKLPIPPTPKFNDSIDEPINEIELEIKKMQEQRKYDIELIHKSHSQNNSDNNNNDNILDNKKKHISWSNDNKFYDYQNVENVENIQPALEIQENNIFSKFKKINNTIEPTFQIQLDNLKQEISQLNEKIDRLFSIINKNDTF